MVKSKIIIDEIEKIAPLRYSYDWDNSGLMVGSTECNISKVMLCLDITPKVVAQAISENCDLIISHHPLLFKSLNVIDYTTAKGKMIKDIINNNITVYSAHTNIDSADGGINTVLAAMFQLQNVEVLESNVNYPEIGIGRIGCLKEEISFAQLCDNTKQILGTDFLKVVGNANSLIKKLCVASGSCGDLIPLAASKGADAVITADVKYHEALDAVEMGISVIDAGHYPTEIIVCEIFKNIISKFDVEIVIADSCDVFSIS